MISAVNGDLWLDNIYCFRYRVKLNNPLMGTEIVAVLNMIDSVYCYPVKLNNPLMGTETIQANFGTFHSNLYSLLN